MCGDMGWKPTNVRHICEKIQLWTRQMFIFYMRPYMFFVLDLF